MILSDKRIMEEMEKGTIKIQPYDRVCLGSNSYDVHLGPLLATYREHILDAKKHNEIESFEIPEEGFILYPHIFYLGVTAEYTETHEHVPFFGRQVLNGPAWHRYSCNGRQGRCRLLRKLDAGDFCKTTRSHLQRNANRPADLFSGGRRNRSEIQSEKRRQIFGSD